MVRQETDPCRLRCQALGHLSWTETSHHLLSVGGASPDLFLHARCASVTSIQQAPSTMNGHACGGPGWAAGLFTCNSSGSVNLLVLIRNLKSCARSPRS